jgi:hypothetical protein
MYVACILRETRKKIAKQEFEGIRKINGMELPHTYHWQVLLGSSDALVPPKHRGGRPTLGLHRTVRRDRVLAWNDGVSVDGDIDTCRWEHT